MQRIKSFAQKTTAGAITSLTLASTALAADPKRPDIDNPVSGTDLGSVLSSVINALLLFAGAVAVLFLIIGGFRYVVSAGSPDQVEGAKKTILYAIVGLIIIFIAFVLVQLIQNYLGVTNGFLVR
jgi:lysylphosphatidylglycerol synthetase-like protein (DUF2156 family)